MFFFYCFFFYIVQSIVMVNLNTCIYLAYFHFVLVSLCVLIKLIKSNQVIIIMLYVYIFTKDLFILHFVYEFFIFSKNAHFLNVFFFVIH